VRGCPQCYRLATGVDRRTRIHDLLHIDEQEGYKGLT